MNGNAPAKNLTILFLAGVIVVTGYFMGQQHAPAGPGNAMESFLKARAVLQAALEAHGGFGAEKTLQTAAFELMGDRVMRLSEYHHETSPPRTPYSNYIAIDFSKNWAFIDEKKYYGIDLHEGDRTFVMKNNEIFSIVHETKSVQINDIINPFPNTDIIHWSLPHLLFKKINEDVFSLFWVGEIRENDQAYDVITFPWRPSIVLTLYFNQKTGRLHKIQRPTQDTVAGDTVIDYVFEEYTQKGDYWFPEKYRIAVNHEPIFDLEMKNVQINAGLNESLFSYPEDYPVVTLPSKATTVVEEVAEDVFLVNTPDVRHNSFFVEMDDYVIVVEAPLNSFYGNEALDLVKQTVPEKPIRYIVPTHYHWDHAGGVRPYVAAGATVVTTTGNQAFFDKIIGARYSIYPDAISENPQEPKYKLVDDRLVLEDENHRVEIINIGPNPHVKDLYIVYIPEQGVVMTGDTFEHFPGHRVPPASNATVSFAERLEEMQIKPDLILETHSYKSTWEDLMLALELRKAKAKN